MVLVTADVASGVHVTGDGKRWMLSRISGRMRCRESRIHTTCFEQTTTHGTELQASWLVVKMGFN